MPDFYFRFIGAMRWVGVSAGLLLLGLLSLQAQAASRTPAVVQGRAMPLLQPPQLIIPNDLTVQPGATFTLPVTLHPHDSAVAATAFSIDYDETWLTFDPTDSNKDGLPDAVRFRGPAAFNLAMMVDTNDHDGEIDVVVADLFPPIATLPDGVLLEVTFKAGEPTLSVDAPVKFSKAPMVSFSNAMGQSIAAPLGGVDGVVHILKEPVSTASPTATAIPTLPTLIPSATATASSTPTVTPTPTPTPSVPAPSTPAVQVAISTLAPDRGGTLLPNEVTIMGRNFVDGAVVTLGTEPVTTLAAVYVSSTYLRVTVPASIAPGRYALTVRNPNGEQATLADAYQVIDQTLNDDLFGQAATFWRDPATARAQSPVQLGLVVYRQGGRTPLANVAVQFYMGNPDAGGTLIGTGTIPLLSPRSNASTAAVTWTPPAAGAYTLFAVIDPENTVVEGDETNNRIERSLTVAAAAPDTLAPHVDTFVINNGAISTTVLSAFLDTTASDPTLPPPSSGMGALFFIEYEYSPSAALWVPVQSSGWLPYGDAQAHFPWQLMPASGMKYVQAWAADQAGNISVSPAQTLINYLPPTDRVLQNQTRIYRYALTAGQPLHARLVPTQGDPDLYIWPPDYTTRPPWVSNLAGEGVVDEIALVAPVTGIYQVEVYGYTTAAYQLSITQDAGAMAATTRVKSALIRQADKPQLTQPVLALDDLPTRYQQLPAVPNQLLTPQVYLPLINR